MRNFTLNFLFLLSITIIRAQLPNGAQAPNWTLSDINSNQWELYDLTNSGKTVFIFHMATWDGVGWNYHNSGALQSLYNEHGPAGIISNDVMVFMIEGDASTSEATLYDGAGIVGDWVLNTPYPIIDLGPQTNSFNALYDIQYIPTLYKVCPDNKIYEVGLISSAQLVSSVTDCISFSYDAYISSGPNPTQCMSNSFAPTITLRNNGSETLTSCNISYEYDNSGIIQNYVWNGVLTTFQSDIISLPLESFSVGNHNLRVITSNPNGAQDEDTSNDIKDFPFVVGGSAFASISVTDCDSYTAPSGAVFTASGIYNDVVDFLNGCGDSTYTIDLTINNSTQNSFSETICNGSVYSWNNQDYTSTGTYSQTFPAMNGCDSVVSLNLTVNNINVVPPNICVVGVDSLTNKNRVVWESIPLPEIDSFYVYKETTISNVYAKIGSKSAADINVFIDQSSNPSIQSDRYKLSIIDTCGYETGLSDFHKTIHLTINSGVGGVWNLIWSHYEGVAFNSYNIYRGTSLSDMTLLTTIQSNLNSFSDLTPPAGYVYYQIEIVNPFDCDPTKAVNYGASRSNIASNNVNSISDFNDNELPIFPNPTTNSITLQPSSNWIGKAFLLIDTNGKIVLKGKLSTFNQQVDLENIEKGIYLLEVEDGAVYKIIKN